MLRHVRTVEGLGLVTSSNVEVCSRYVASNLYDIKRFYIFATRNSAINEMRFFSLVVFRMCSRLAVTAALLGRWLPALNPTSGSSPSGSSDKLRATVPSGPALSPVHLLSNVLDSLLMENLTLTESVTPFTVGMKLAASPPPSLHYWGWQGSLQSVSSIPFIPLRSPSSTSPPPHVSSVKWKSCPIKKRQPGADHGRTYANVDTVKYHTRRGGKISLRGKQIG